MRTPDFHKFDFVLSENGYYQRQNAILGFSKVPEELKVERTRKRDLINSEFIVRGRIRNKTYLYFTGILKTDFENWYFGDFFERTRNGKVNSYNLFRFSPDLKRFTLFFFPAYKLYPNKREEFNRAFINQSEQKNKGGEYPASL